MNENQTKNCEFCAEEIPAIAKKCKHCGEILDAHLRATLEAKERNNSWNAGLAFVLGLFIPGAGQMYRGKVGNGIFWFFATFIGYILFLVPGIVFHIISLVLAVSKDPDPSKVLVIPKQA